MTSLLAVPPRVAGQAGAPNPGGTPQTPNGPLQTPNAVPLPGETLIIYVLEGQNQIHDIRNPQTVMAVVEVRDENALPVQGADVTFELPAKGASGTFGGQALTFQTKTNDQGQALAAFLPNSVPGRFSITVTAKLGNRAGRATIAQSNARRAGVAQPKGGFFKFAWWKVGVVAAGVGVVVAILVTRGGSGSSPTLIPGTPTFGAP